MATPLPSRAPGPGRLVAGSLAHPWWVLVVVAAATLLALPGLFRLRLLTDGAALAPADDPAIRIDREVRAHFDLRDPLVILVESRRTGGIWNPASLAKLRDLTAAVAALPGLEPGQVTSLARQRGFAYDTGRNDFRTLLDPLPRTAADLAELQEDVRRLDLPIGLLVSPRGEAATVVVGVPPAGLGRPMADRYQIWRTVEATARRFADADHAVEVIGAPAAEALLGHHILDDLTYLLPASIALLAAVFFLGARRWAAVGVGMAKVGVCLVVLFGFMGWIGAPIYLTTAVLPVILVTVGLADEIHLLWRYRELLAESPSPAAARQRTFAELTRPVVLALVTTAFGFASFLTSSIVPIAAFGLFAALGVGLCLLYSLTATPALLAVLPAAWFVPRRAGPPVEGAWSGRLASFVGRRPRRVLAGLAAATALAAAGIPRLTVQDSWLDGFARGSSLLQATERFDRLFFGTHRLLAAVRFPPSRERSGRVYNGPLVEPAVLAPIGELEALLAADPRVGGVVGPYRLLTTTAGIAGGGDAQFRRLRPTADGNGLLWAYLENGVGKVGRHQAVDAAFERGVITIYLKGANFRDTEEIVGRVRRFERERLAPLGGRIDLAGDVAVSQAMIPAIVQGQVGSLSGSLVCSALMSMLLFRSWRRGLLAVVPTTAAVVWILGAMGWLGIPLGVATSMFCAITLGIGDDYAIHLLERHRLAIDEGERRPAWTAIAAAGPAIVWDTLAIALGFGLLAVSQVPANRRLGLLVAAALAAACLFSLLGLGAWLGRGETPAEKM